MRAAGEMHEKNEKWKYKHHHLPPLPLQLISDFLTEKKKKKQQDKDSLLIPPQNLQPTCAYAQMIPLAETHKPLIQSKVCSSTSARTSSTLTLQALSVSSVCCHINRFRMSLVVPSVYKWVLIMLILKKKQANKPHYNLTVSFIHPFSLTVKMKVFWVICPHIPFSCFSLTHQIMLTWSITP